MSNTHTRLTIADILTMSIGSLIEVIRGPFTLLEINSESSEIESMIGHSINGFTIKIHCQERNYLCRYRHWYVLDRVKTVYHVFTEVSPDAPESLKVFCERKRDFPKLLNGLMPSASQKEAAIRAYLDLIIQHFKEAS